MANPSKPSTVKINVMKRVLEDLQSIQYDIQNPPVDSFESITGDMHALLKKSDDTGLQENGTKVAGDRYHSSVHYLQQGWRDTSSGVNALVTLLQATIAKHSAADGQAADNASNTNTSTSGASKGA
ncbi:hypothetical protein [uncultured Jatrophihabitans sp.]|uniref:hypothetical protein n=1 Tax=uncultured Jatrophihabitans sp. TaxID=1610747 RepID=UPI0035CA23D8